MESSDKRIDRATVFAEGGMVRASYVSLPPELIRSAQVKVIAWALAHDIPKETMLEVLFTLGIHPEQLEEGTGLPQ